MKKHIFPILVLAGLLSSCGKGTCDCTPGHDDYEGHCPCYADDCQCPVRLRKTVWNGELVFDIWNRDPLTTKDTLFVKATAATFMKPISVFCGYYNFAFDSIAPDTYLAKLTMPAGEYTLQAIYTESTYYYSSTLARNVKVIN